MPWGPSHLTYTNRYQRFQIDYVKGQKKNKTQISFIWPTQIFKIEPKFKNRKTSYNTPAHLEEMKTAAALGPEEVGNGTSARLGPQAPCCSQQWGRTPGAIYHHTCVAPLLTGGEISLCPSQPELGKQKINGLSRVLHKQIGEHKHSLLFCLLLSLHSHLSVRPPSRTNTTDSRELLAFTEET